MNKDNPNYRWYVLAVLTLVYVFNFVDRQILVVLQEPIKAEMGLSDTQLGLLTGFLFAVFYVTLGIPIARIADKGNRRNVIAWSISLWSLMTALSGLVTSYWQLVLARIGVGIGEAGGSPPAHSIISDYFPPERRSTALAIFSSGVFVGIMLGFVIGGTVAESFGWRAAFFAVGIPGLLVALLVRFTITEPPRGRYDTQQSDDDLPGIFQALNTFWQLKTFRYLAIGCAISQFSSYGVGNWMPGFMIRHYGISVGDAGLLFASLYGAGGLTGSFLSGYLADRLGAHDQRWYLWLPGLSFVMIVPLNLLACLTNNLTVAAVANLFSIFFSAFFLGPAIATCHALVQPRLRALISALLFFILNLVGLGLGPVFTGFVSDMLTPEYGADGLRYAMIATTLIGGQAIWLYLMAARFTYAETQQAKLKQAND